MVDIKELWIGDRLRIMSSGKKGTFEGMTSVGLARVKVDGMMHFVPPDQLELVAEDAFEPESTLDWEENDLKSEEVAAQIDLHIEKLNPSMVHRSPQEILAHQKQRCASYLEKASSSKVDRVVIIHGKGVGALRQEILDLLHRRTDVRHIQLTNNGGATEVFFSS